jgi:hypothetical protein
MLRSFPRIGSVADAKKLLFRPETPDSLVEECWSHLGSESRKAVREAVLLKVEAQEIAQHFHILVQDGTSDVMAGNMCDLLGELYSVMPRLYAAGHDMMLDSGFEMPARDIVSWLNTRYPASASADDREKTLA